jgi:hypothetical protein
VNNNIPSGTYQLPLNSTVDPGFADYARLNSTLRPDSPIYSTLPLPHFKPIPFGKIGMYLDRYRRVLPTNEQTRRLELAPKAGEVRMRGGAAKKNVRKYLRFV